MSEFTQLEKSQPEKSQPEKLQPEAPQPKEPKKPRKTSAFQNLMSVHWVMAGCYLVLFIVGTFMAQLPRETPFRSPLYDFHKSVGILTIGLLTARILVLLQVWWRKYARRFPKLTAPWFRMVALHLGLYLFMIVVPVSGVFFSNSFRSNNVKLFGLLLPDVFPQNSAAVELGRSLHFWLSYTFLAFIVLHILEQRKVARSLWRRFTGAIAKLSS